MNGQIVLCKGINDGEHLERTIRELSGYLPHLRSVSVVPVGLTRFREGLYPLEPFRKEDALQVVEQIHRWQRILYEKWGTHFIHCSDEWYILAGLPLPEAEQYDGYPQLENGVGMQRLLEEEVDEALAAETVLIPSAAFPWPQDFWQSPLSAAHEKNSGKISGYPGGGIRNRQ